jgi:peptidoglycan/LPS O-acetylase OafA/YrhL
MLGLTALSVLVTTPVAYLFWQLIEVPGINLGKRFVNTYAERPAPA